MLFICFIIFIYSLIRFLNGIQLFHEMQSTSVSQPPKYAVGTYDFPQLRIGSVSFNAQVEVFRQQEPISRDKPTAFVAGHGYEKQLGITHPVDLVIYKAQELGAELGEIYTIISGHCQGAPGYVAESALKKGGGVIGLSPYKNDLEHLKMWRTTKIYTETDFKLEPRYAASIAIHTGLGFWHRDVCNNELTNNHRQIVYVVGGSEGTFHETIVGNAHHAIIGALLGVGGVSDDIDSVIDYLRRHDIEHNIVKDTDPKALVQKVMELDKKLKEQNHDGEISTTPLIELLDTLETRIIASPSP